MAAGIAIAHNAAVHGHDPKSPADYMPFIKKEKPKPQPEEDMKKVWGKICEIRGAEESDVS